MNSDIAVIEVGPSHIVGNKLTIHSHSWQPAAPSRAKHRLIALHRSPSGKNKQWQFKDALVPVGFHSEMPHFLLWTSAKNVKGNNIRGGRFQNQPCPWPREISRSLCVLRYVLAFFRVPKKRSFDKSPFSRDSRKLRDSRELPACWKKSEILGMPPVKRLLSQRPRFPGPCISSQLLASGQGNTRKEGNVPQRVTTIPWYYLRHSSESLSQEFWSLFGNGANTVSESTVSNTKLSEFFGPHRLPGGKLSEFLSAYYLCAKANSPSFLQNSPSLPQNSVSSLLRNSTLETVFRPFPIYFSCFVLLFHVSAFSIYFLFFFGKSALQRAKPAPTKEKNIKKIQTGTWGPKPALKRANRWDLALLTKIRTWWRLQQLIGFP